MTWYVCLRSGPSHERESSGATEGSIMACSSSAGLWSALRLRVKLESSYCTHADSRGARCRLRRHSRATGHMQPVVAARERPQHLAVCGPMRPARSAQSCARRKHALRCLGGRLTERRPSAAVRSPARGPRKTTTPPVPPLRRRCQQTSPRAARHLRPAPAAREMHHASAAPGRTAHRSGLCDHERTTAPSSRAWQRSKFFVSPLLMQQTAQLMGVTLAA